MDEEVVLLEEQLAAAHADIERLQARLADSEALSSTHASTAHDLRRQLDAVGQQIIERDGVLTTQATELEALRSKLDAGSLQAQTDAERYRSLVLAHEPDLPAELVSGDSIESLEQSIVRARQTVAQVRQHIEEQARAQRVPAGAPVRSAPDVADLSPAEKIRLGLQG